MVTMPYKPSREFIDHHRAQAAKPAGASTPSAASHDALREKFEALKIKLLDSAEAMLDRINARHTPEANLPLVTARRQIAQIVGAPQFCSRKLCRRTKACCGEPKHCLLIALPLLPPELTERLVLGARKTRRGRAC